MRLGQLLSGAGVAATSIRQAEEAERVARQNQLAIEEQNRLRALQDEASRRGLASRMAGPAPQVGVFAPGQAYGEMPAAVAPAAPVAPAAAPATPEVSPEAWQQEDLAQQVGLRMAPTTQPAARGGELPPAVESLGVQVDQARAAHVAAQQQLRQFGMRQRRDDAAGYEQAKLEEMRTRQARDAAEKAYAQAVTPFAGAVTSPMRVRPPTAAPTAPAAPAAPAAAAAPSAQPLFAAMVQVESAGRPEAVSPKGAVGLMQVLPSTAMKPGFGLPNVFDFAQQMGVQVRSRNEDTARRLLADPAVGAAYGQQYMNAMLQRYNGNLVHALAAYNAGPGRIDQWISAGADPEKLPKETRDYVPKVLAAMSSQTTGAPQPVPTTPPARTADSVAKAAQPVAPAKGGTMYGPAVVDASPNNPRIQEVLSQRQALVEQIGLMEQYGFGLRAMELIPQVRAIDLGLYKAQADQGIYEGTTTGNFSRAMSMLSHFRGMPHQVLDRGDQTYDLYVGGKISKTGMSVESLADLIRSNVDEEYRKQKADLAGARAKQQMKIEEIVAKEVANAAGNLQVALVNAQAKLQAAGIAANKADVKVDPNTGRWSVMRNGELFVVDPSAVEEVRGVRVPSPVAQRVAGLR